MKKFIILFCITLSALLILDSMDTAHALTLFLLAGIIPGTDIVMSADSTLTLFAVLLGFVVARSQNAFLKTLGAFRQQQLVNEQR